MVGAVLAEQHGEWAEGRRDCLLDALKWARTPLTVVTTDAVPTRPFTIGAAT